MNRDTPTVANVVELPVSKQLQRGGVAPILPTEGRLWLAACFVMLLTGLMKGINLLILLSYLLIGVWIVNWHLVRQNVRRAKGRRMAPGPIFAGEECEIQTEIACDDAGSLRGIAIRERGGDHDRQWLILHLPEGSTVRVRWRHTFTKRGRYRLEPLHASSQFPFGLTCRSVDLTPADEWIILPQLGGVNSDHLKHWLVRLSHGDGRTRRRKMHRTTRDADIHGLRDYRPGDSPRLIHWRSTARRGQLLVREFEDNEAPTNLVLVVEPWLPSVPGKAHFDRLESLISLAATVCKEWCRDLSARLTLIIAKPSAVFFSASTGSEFALRLLEGLAVEEGNQTTDRSWFEQMPAQCRSAPILVLSSNPSSDLANEIAAFMGHEVAQTIAGDALPWYEPPTPLAT